MPRFLVTGAGGVVGSALVSKLQSDGSEVIALHSRSDSNLESHSEVRALLRFVKPDAVIHLAGAVYGVGGNLKFPGDSFRRNVLMNTFIVDACREFAVRKVVAMGSAAMYADGLRQPFDEGDAMVGRPHSSEEAYGFAKRAMLVQLESYEVQFGLRWAFAVATNIYGPHDRFDVEHGHVVPSLVRKFVEADQTGDIVKIWGDGSPRRDFLFSEDAASGLVAILRNGAGAINLATGTSHTITDVVLELARVFPRVCYEWDVSKPLGQLDRSYNISRLASLGFKPEWALREGLRKTAAWFQANQDKARVSI